MIHEHLVSSLPPMMGMDDEMVVLGDASVPIAPHYTALLTPTLRVFVFYSLTGSWYVTTGRTVHACKASEINTNGEYLPQDPIVLLTYFEQLKKEHSCVRMEHARWWE